MFLTVALPPRRRCRIVGLPLLLVQSLLVMVVRPQVPDFRHYATDTTHYATSIVLTENLTANIKTSIVTATQKSWNEHSDKEFDAHSKLLREQSLLNMSSIFYIFPQYFLTSYATSSISEVPLTSFNSSQNANRATERVFFKRPLNYQNTYKSSNFETKSRKYDESLVFLKHPRMIQETIAERDINVVPVKLSNDSFKFSDDSKVSKIIITKIAYNLANNKSKVYSQYFSGYSKNAPETNTKFRTNANVERREGNLLTVTTADSHWISEAFLHGKFKLRESGLNTHSAVDTEAASEPTSSAREGVVGVPVIRLLRRNLLSVGDYNISDYYSDSNGNETVVTDAENATAIFTAAKETGVTEKETVVTVSEATEATSAVFENQTGVKANETEEMAEGTTMTVNEAAVTAKVTSVTAKETPVTAKDTSVTVNGTTLPTNRTTRNCTEWRGGESSLFQVSSSSSSSRDGLIGPLPAKCRPKAFDAHSFTTFRERGKTG